MKDQTQNKSKFRWIPSQKEMESGQTMVIGVGIICALGITFLFYLSLQRAFTLANFLDETAELAAQSAADPSADDIVAGDVRIDPAEAEGKARATVQFAAARYGGEFDSSSAIGGATYADYLSTTGFDHKVLNVGDSDPICRAYKDGGGDNSCTFPIVWVELTAPIRLFGVEFTIRTDGVATLGSNSEKTEAIPVDLPTPTPIPPSSPITIDAG